MAAIFFILSLWALSAAAFETGFNQGWIENNFGKSLSKEHFNEEEIRRLMRLGKEAGGNIQRIWLFENYPGPPITLAADGRPNGLDETFKKNLRRYYQIAKEEGIQVYLTLFDANVTNHGFTPAQKDHYWNVLNDKFGYGKAFREKVLDPVLNIQKDFPDNSYGLDLVNEINAFVDTRKGGVWFENKWEGANRFAKTWRDFVKQRSKLPVTVSVGWHKAADHILNGDLDLSNVDFADVHLYNNSGKIKNCAKLVQRAKSAGKPIILGEFGQTSKSFNDELQSKVTQNFLSNAKDCGFSGALAWRLSDIRPGHNPEARHSFEAFGKVRPAYEVIKEFNKGSGERSPAKTH